MQSFGILSVLPPVLTIVLAIYTRNVLISLGSGALLGAFIVKAFHPLDSVLYLVGDKIFSQIASPANNQVIITMACIGGFISLVSASGGAMAFASHMTKYISTPFKAQVATWLAGLGIFFSDSGNSLILGPLFAPIYNRLGICKEKLAYILDSTSAPICILIPFISWGAYIMSLIESTYLDMGLSENPLTVLLNAMPYQLYAILTLIAVPTIAFFKKDFGNMLKAQKEFVPEKVVHEVEVDSESSIAAILLPLGTLFLSLAFLMSYFAMGEDGLQSSSIRVALFISYILASLSSALYMKKKYGKKLKKSLTLFVKGGESMVFIFYILILAWTLSSICKDLQTGQYIAEHIKIFVSPYLFPMIVFFLGALISLATGSSYGTFAILMPIALPISFDLGVSLFVTVGAILSGGLFGDHTSPISDTTVLSSMGADCEHIRHVNTQMTYSILTGCVCVVGFIVAAITESPLTLLVAIILQFILLYVVMKKWGEKTPL